MGLDRPLAQTDAPRRRTVVITARVPVANYEKIRERAIAKGCTTMGEHLRNLAYADAGIEEGDGSQSG